MSLFYAILLGFSCGVAGGGSVYLLIHWSHIRFQLDLGYRLEDLEGRVQREVKIRAAQSSGKKKLVEEELFERINAEGKKPEETLVDWRKKAFGR